MGGAKAQALNTGSPCDGKMLTFSFHVEAEDNIRCYMYSMGQMMRFMPKDILTVLPRFFVAEDKKKDEKKEKQETESDTKDVEEKNNSEKQPKIGARSRQPLPEYAVRNEEWVKTEKAKAVVQEMEQLIVDARFNAFYESF